MEALRKTKIIATVGPASEDLKILKALLLSNVNIIRINMSHGTRKRHETVIKNIRLLANELHMNIGILIDLQGPKIRIARFKNNQVFLKVGQTFILDTDLSENDGDNHRVGIDYKELAGDLKIGDNLLLDDGRILMSVEKILSNAIYCCVKLGGYLSNNKGLNRQGGGLSATTLTLKDQEDINFAIKHHADYIAISFPRCSEDIILVKKILKSNNHCAGIISKIERIEALNNLNSIINVSDAIMVARGDLGVEVGFAELPTIQKKIIEKAMLLKKPVITATQMMESMITNTIPTRAEVSDVANAVLEGSDAVMLSAETACGKYPINTVLAMSKICVSTEKSIINNRYLQYQDFERDLKCINEEAIALATMYAANHSEVTAIVALTESGLTPLLMSRIYSNIPIYGITSNTIAKGRMTLYRGVYPIYLDISSLKRCDITRVVLSKLVKDGVLTIGEHVIITQGDVIGTSGCVNSMNIVAVEEIYGEGRYIWH